MVSKETHVPVGRGQLIAAGLSGGYIQPLDLSDEESGIVGRVFDDFQGQVEIDVSAVLSSYLLGKAISAEQRKLLTRLKRKVFTALAEHEEK